MKSGHWRVRYFTPGNRRSRPHLTCIRPCPNNYSCLGDRAERGSLNFRNKIINTQRESYAGFPSLANSDEFGGVKSGATAGAITFNRGSQIEANLKWTHPQFCKALSQTVYRGTEQDSLHPSVMTPEHDPATEARLKSPGQIS